MTDKPVLFHMSEELKKELDILSSREGRTLKAILNEVVENYIKVHKEGNPQHLMDNFLENSDFMGFPSIAISLDKKKKSLELMDEKMIKELFWHIQEWDAIIRKK